jgi:ATP-binding protein involved in chromosome partitioning
MSEPATTPERVEPTDDAARLRIVWKDGHVSEFEPRGLRLECRCAGCVEEMTGRTLLDPAGVQADVYPLEIAYVGRYAAPAAAASPGSTPADSCA